MEHKKTKIPTNQFCKSSCKLQGDIIEAWAHIDLLNDTAYKKLLDDTARYKREQQDQNNTEFECHAPHNCWECPRTNC